MLSGVQAPSHLPLRRQTLPIVKAFLKVIFRGLCQEGSFVEAVDLGSYTKAKLTWNDGKKLDERTFRQLHG